MSLPLFTDSHACRSRVHCGTCRDLAGGVRFREGQRKVFALPNDATNFECPHGLKWGDKPERPPGRVVDASERIAPPPWSGGPALWERLHRDPTGSPELIAAVTAELPQWGCGCQNHWRAILTAVPPRYGADWFAWTVMAHNMVNARLGKPTISEDEARGRWAAASSCPR